MLASGTPNLSTECGASTNYDLRLLSFSGGMDRLTSLPLRRHLYLPGRNRRWETHDKCFFFSRGLVGGAV
jgi:hypothetical protein